jgi:hypothetical protein
MTPTQKQITKALLDQLGIEYREDSDFIYVQDISVTKDGEVITAWTTFGGMGFQVKDVYLWLGY